ncbi:MAG: hypothetical protein QF569_15200 [Candidatus Poribacteria bacterium]|nr:hypothetical protein [Candidatus Poribacteria bacterium]
MYDLDFCAGFFPYAKEGIRRSMADLHHGTITQIDYHIRIDDWRCETERVVRQEANSLQ